MLTPTILVLLTMLCILANPIYSEIQWHRPADRIGFGQINSSQNLITSNTKDKTSKKSVIKDGLNDKSLEKKGLKEEIALPKKEPKIGLVVGNDAAKFYKRGFLKDVEPEDNVLEEIFEEGHIKLFSIFGFNVYIRFNNRENGKGRGYRFREAVMEDHTRRNRLRD